MQRCKNNISLLKYFTVATLLGIYITASFFNNFHNYFHHDHQREACTAETDKDPCHQKVFHHSQTDGCKHETHVFTLDNKCELCDAILAKYYFPDVIKTKVRGKEIFQYSSIFDETFVSKILNASISLRGPPALLFYST